MKIIARFALKRLYYFDFVMTLYIMFRLTIFQIMRTYNI
jgi:hypothetical protein